MVRIENYIDSTTGSTRSTVDTQDYGMLRKFNVTITETLKLTVGVEAANQQEAEEIVPDKWNESKYILDAENFDSVEFLAVQQDAIKINSILI